MTDHPSFTQEQGRVFSNIYDLFGRNKNIKFLKPDFFRRKRGFDSGCMYNNKDVIIDRKSWFEILSFFSRQGKIVSVFSEGKVTVTKFALKEVLFFKKYPVILLKSERKKQKQKISLEAL